MRKKILVAVLTAAVMCMTGCGGSGSSSEQSTTSTTAVTSKYSFNVGDTKLVIGESGTDALAALNEEVGKPNNEFTQVSCAFEGEDHIYMYDSFEITISTVNDQEVLTAISLTDDMISTPEGIKIGSTDAEVSEKLGVDTAPDGNYQVTDKKTTLTIVVKDDEVISINYSYTE